jgi:hypothetical protein
MTEMRHRLPVPPTLPVMRTVVATAPTGAQWQVRVLWQPRWRALARRFGAWRRGRKRGDGFDLGGLDIPDFGSDGVAAVVVVIVAVVLFGLFGLLFWFLLLPLLLLLVDVVVVVVLLALAIPLRVLLRRPWTVEAVPVAPERVADRFTVQTVGWRRALSTRDEIAQKLRDGYPAPVSV